MATVCLWGCSMGSKSSSASETNTSTTNLALDRSTTVGEGTAIMDAIIVDPSDTVMVETIKQHRAAFEALTSQNTIQLEKVLHIASDVMRLADSQQIQMSNFGYQMLQSGVEMLNAAKEQGKYTIDFATAAVEQTFSFAGGIADDNHSTVSRALDLVGEVRTDDRADTLKTLATMITVFGLGGLYLLTRKV